MITNICIVGLLKKYTKSISKRVADTLDMFYADVTELLEYEYINMANAEKIVGKEYMEKQPKAIEQEINEVVNGFKQLNRGCIKGTNCSLFINIMIKFVIFSVLALIF